MQSPVNTSLLALLLKAYNEEVKDFYYFPDVVFIGRQRVEVVAFKQLLNEGYLQQTHCDTFGRFYKLSPEAEQVLFTHLHKGGGHRRKKGVSAPHQQCFSFD